MIKTLEAQFTREDINEVAAWVYRGNELLTGSHEFTEDWSTRVIEKLRPYAFDGNVADMLVGALGRQYKKKIGKEYQQTTIED
jgi:hypothetical protein